MNTKSTPKMTLQEALRELRQAMNLSQEGLARQLNLSFRTIHRFENELPPKGEWLLMFGKLAVQHDRRDLANVFYNAFGEQFGLKGSSGAVFKGTVSNERLPNGERVGYMVVSLEGVDEVRFAIAAMYVLNTGLKDAATRKIAADLISKAAALMNPKPAPLLPVPTEIFDEVYVAQ
jgi:transcriptional regulator with XRE-family HTH domain